MPLLSRLISYSHRLLRREQTETDLDEEILAHIELLTEQKIKEGMNPEEARRAAKIEVGGIEQVKEQVRAVRVGAWLESLLQDIRFGLRMLRKSPGFTAVAVITLALGIGANTAIFSVVYAVLLNPIPYSQPDRIVSVFVTWPSYSHGPFDYPNFLDVQRETRSLSGLSAWRVDSFTLTGAGEPEELHGKMTTSNYFSLLGIPPVLGRTFRHEDDQLGAAPVVILGEGLWKRRFASDQQIVGKSVSLSDKDYTVIGVVPSDVHFLRFQDSFYDDLFLPVGQWDNGLFRDRRFSLGLRAVGRLRAGASLNQAQAEMNEIAKNLDVAYPNENSGMGLGVIPFKDELTYPTEPAVLLLWGAVALVMLIACVNVGNLLLVHSAMRKQEFAVRAALGASRARLIRQMLIQSIVLATIGGAIGVALAGLGTSALLGLFPASLPAISRVELNSRILIFAVVLCVTTGILFGILPAIEVSKASLYGKLKDGDRGRSGSRHRAQDALIATQIGLALVLLVGAGLLVRSLTKVWAVNPGFNPEQLLAFHVAFSSGNLTDADKTHTILRELNERLALIPGVEAVGLNLGILPLEGDSEVPLWPDEKPRPTRMRDWPLALCYEVSPDYFKAMGIPLIRGRVFTEQDAVAGPATLVIDEDLATGIFAGEDPIGKWVEFGAGNQASEIIGVVGHVKHWGLDAEARASVYYQVYGLCLRLSGPILPIMASSTWVEVRSALPPSVLLGTLRKELGALDSGAAVYNVQTMHVIVVESLAGRTFLMVLLSIFAAIALMLAVIGAYGVVSYSVAQRTHEIGIRMALGAQPGSVVRMVLRQGGIVALMGVAMGIPASFGLARLMKSMLFGVTASDPLTFASVAIVLLVVALAACWIPARRAAGVDPMVALRHE